MIFDARRPIVLNGIPDLAARPDLGDRAVTVTLQPIEPKARRPESELWAAFEAARPEILGALLDAVSSALRHLPTTQLDSYERMADFALWVTAAEPGLGWDPGTFAAAYRANREGAVELTVENDPVACALRAMVEKRREPFEGSASELLPELEGETTEKIRNSRVWPSNAAALATRLRRLAPVLRQVGIDVLMDQRAPTRDRKRLIQIERRV